MGIRKKHHYIPRFYLKRFSVNDEGKQICLYNHKTKTFVTNAPIKHQACEEYLYGRDDEIEAELGKLENTIALFFHYWTDIKELLIPPEGSNGLILLKRFILYQLFRIPKAGSFVDMKATEALKVYLQLFQTEKVKEYEGYEIKYNAPVLMALTLAADKEFLLGYLKCKFLVNLSDLPFITSDAPVVLYNQFMERAGLYMGATGLSAKGLQIFYPIHPRLMICLYDPKTYQYKGKCLSTESIEDVHQLNALQFINSNSLLFFNDTLTKDYIKIITEKYSKAKNSAKPVGNFVKSETDKLLYLSSFEDAQIDLELSFCTILPPEKNAILKISPLRHPSFERETKKMEIQNI